jgi:outer membrane protein OmpA-like peptidoglycan-associated protein
LLRAQQRQQVAAWTDSVTAQLTQAAPHLTATCRNSGAASGGAMDEAAATLASFNQVGLDLGRRKVIVALDQDASPASHAGLPQDLQGATVVASGFTGGSQEQAAWQNRLLAAGASRVALLTPGAGPALAPIVDEALTGAIVESRHAAVLFRRGEATLQPAARAPLTRILRGLTTQPGATAVISGYTDDLPTPEGNDALSTRRAVAVKRWLAAHGVASSRLQVAGQGAAFPIAPNGPHGQPANRRVEIVLDPVSSPDTG